MSKRKREWPPPGAPLPRPVTDNHTHLPLHEGEIPSPGGVKLSLVEQLARASQVGVARMISSGCERPDWAPTVALTRQYPQVRAALAIHPNEAPLHAGILQKSPDGHEHAQQEHHIPLDGALAELETYLSDPGVVAVGETGLDYYRTGEAGKEAQQESFRAHLALARDYGLPLQIHDREAHRDTLAVLRESASADQAIVFHCFSGDAELAAELAANGWYASFAGNITYPVNDGLRAGLLAMPRELVLVETDAPYLTSVPYRGCPNASYVMPHTVAAIAALWTTAQGSADLAATADQLRQNTENVYGSW